MSERRRYHSGERERSKLERRHSRERRRHSRSASPSRRRSRSRSRDRGDSSKSTKRVERSRSPKRRRRERSRSRDKRRSRSRSHSRDRERRRSHKRHSRSRSRSYDSDDRRRRRKEKKEKKKEKKGKSAVSAAEWGKYGIIGEADMRDKDPEFRTWLIEERMLNPETTSDDQLKKLFKEFAEDYNTATLPHEKYYNMDAYERRMRIVRSGESNLLEGLDTYDPSADVLAHTKRLKRTPQENESFLSKHQLEELRKVKMERDQVGKMKLLGMSVDSKMGVRMDTNYE